MRSRMDLETVTIERGRDAGLASFNNARVAYGLEPIRDFSQLNPDLPADVSLLLSTFKFAARLGLNEIVSLSPGSTFIKTQLQDWFCRGQEATKFAFTYNI